MKIEVSFGHRLTQMNTDSKPPRHEDDGQRIKDRGWDITLESGVALLAAAVQDANGVVYWSLTSCHLTNLAGVPETP